MPENADKTQEHQPSGATQEREAQHQENGQAGFTDNREATERRRAVQERIPGKPIGRVKKGIRFSTTIHFYEKNEQTDGFVRHPTRTLRKGTLLTEVLKTEDKHFVWIKTVNGEEGYVRKQNLQINNLPNYFKSSSYFDDHNLLHFAGDKKPASFRPYHPANREWYITQAILMDAYRSLSITPESPERDETMHDLALAMMQSTSKVAAIKTLFPNNAVNNNRPGMGRPKSNEENITAFYDGDTYYRSQSPQLLTDLEKLLPGRMKLSPRIATVKAISDKHFGEVLQRTHPLLLSNDAAPHTTRNDTQIDTTIEDLDDFADKINKICTNIIAGNEPRNPYFFDISALYNYLQLTPQEIKKSIITPLNKEVKKIVGRQPVNKAMKAKLVSGIYDKLNLFIITKYEGINTLIIPHLQLTNRNTTDDISRIIGHYGQKPDPITAKEHLLKLATPGEMLKMAGSDQEVPAVTLFTPRGHENDNPVVFEKIDDFIQSHVFISFKMLSEGDNIPPYQKIYPAATAHLIMGLRHTPGGIDEVFRKKGITQVLQFAYYRMLIAMSNALSHTGTNMTPFLNAIDLIHDQLQMILAIVRPYKQDTDFAESVQAALREKPWRNRDVPEDANMEDAPQVKKRHWLLRFLNRYSPMNWFKKNEQQQPALPPPPQANPVLPESLPNALVHHKASAMHAVGSILSGVEKESGNDNRLNVLVLKDSYYEAVGAGGVEDGIVQEAKTYNTWVLNGQELKKNYNNITDAYDKTPDPGTKFDIFLCEFHHNISLYNNEYHTEEVVRQVKTLFEKDLVAPKFTVAIDCTIDFLRSSDMQEFLAAFEEEIRSGQLNVVFFRSAQKYDMLGLDNYYGGYTITINNNTIYKAFNDRISDKDDQVPGLAHQGLTHLVKYGSEYQDAYRDTLMKNTRYLYDKLIAAGFGDPNRHLHIARSDDKQMVFVDIIIGGTFSNDRSRFVKVFTKWLQYYNLAVSKRSSFGFPTTNFLEIMPKLRLNPGLESKAVLDGYVFFFKKIHQLIEAGDFARFADLTEDYKNDEYNPWKNITEEEPEPADQPQYNDYFMGNQPTTGNLASYCGYYAFSNYLGKPIDLKTYQLQMHRQFRAIGIAENEMAAFINDAGTAAEAILVNVYHFTEDSFLRSRSLPDEAIVNCRFLAATPGHILTYKKDDAGTWWELDSLASTARPIGNRAALTTRLQDKRTMNIYYSDVPNLFISFLTGWNKLYNWVADIPSNFRPSKNNHTPPEKQRQPQPDNPRPTPPQLFFLQQPKTGKLSRYCGYYALSNYLDQEPDLNNIEEAAITHRQQATGETRSDIQARMNRDGVNVQPIAVTTYQLSESRDPTAALQSGRFMAATYRYGGHWLTYIRANDGNWWEYDSWLSAPRLAGTAQQVRNRLAHDKMSNVYWAN